MNDIMVERDYSCYSFGQVVAIALCVLLLGTTFAYIGSFGLARGERAECLKWQSQAEEFAGNTRAAQYYLKQWQKDQCAAHGITINAPVK